MRSRHDSDEALARTENIREGRIFAFTLAGGFLVIALLAMRKGGQRIEAVAFSLSAISALAGVIAPGRLGPARRAWMKIGEAIGFVTTPIVMAVIYYLILTPMGIARRLAVKRATVKDSSWHKRPPLPPAERMERQF